MIGDCTRCMAMCWKGVRTGLQIIQRSLILTQKGQNQAVAACCAVARGSPTAGTAGLLSAATLFRLTATTTLAFALPEVIELRSGAGQQPRDGARGGQPVLQRINQ